MKVIKVIKLIKLVLVSILISFLFCGKAISQYLPVNPTAYGSNNKRVMAGTAIMLPTICGTPSFMSSYSVDSLHSAYIFDSCGHKGYIYDPSLRIWSIVGAGVNAGNADSLQHIVGTDYLLKNDTATLSNRIDQRVKYSDTSTLSNRINLKLNISDTTAALSNRLKISDTAYALSGYTRTGNLANGARFDTSTLQARFDQKQPLLPATPLYMSDTPTILSGRWLPNRIADSLSNLQSRIQSKLTKSDADTYYASLSHTHTQSQVIGLPDSLLNKVSRSGSYTDPDWLDISFSKINGKPTTISGFGITDAYTKTIVNDSLAALQARIQTKEPLLGFTAVPNTRTVNGHALSSDVTITKSDIGLGSVDNVDTATTLSQAVRTFGDQNITGEKVFDGDVVLNGLLSTSNVLPGSSPGYFTIGNVTFRYYAGYIDTVFSSKIYGTLKTSAQPNITSVGTLANLSVTGSIQAGSIATTGNVVADGYVHSKAQGSGDSYLFRGTKSDGTTDIASFNQTGTGDGAVSLSNSAGAQKVFLNAVGNSIINTGFPTIIGTASDDGVGTGLQVTGKITAHGMSETKTAKQLYINPTTGELSYGDSTVVATVGSVGNADSLNHVAGTQFLHDVTFAADNGLVTTGSLAPAGTLTYKMSNVNPINLTGTGNLNIIGAALRAKTLSATDSVVTQAIKKQTGGSSVEVFTTDGGSVSMSSSASNNTIVKRDAYGSFNATDINATGTLSGNKLIISDSVTFSGIPSGKKAKQLFIDDATGKVYKGDTTGTVGGGSWNYYIPTATGATSGVGLVVTLDTAYYKDDGGVITVLLSGIVYEDTYSAAYFSVTTPPSYNIDYHKAPYTPYVGASVQDTYASTDGRLSASTGVSPLTEIPFLISCPESADFGIGMFATFTAIIKYHKL